MELIDLQKKVQDYVNSGFAHDVVQAARQAQEATRLFIRSKGLAKSLQTFTPTILLDGITRAPWEESSCAVQGKDKKDRLMPPAGPILIRMLTPLGNITWIILSITLSDALTFRR